jgi:hypothetical protein
MGPSTPRPISPVVIVVASRVRRYPPRDPLTPSTRPAAWSCLTAKPHSRPKLPAAQRYLDAALGRRLSVGSSQPSLAARICHVSKSGPWHYPNLIVQQLSTIVNYWDDSNSRCDAGWQVLGTYRCPPREHEQQDRTAPGPFNGDSRTLQPSARILWVSGGCASPESPYGRIASSV